MEPVAADHERGGDPLLHAVPGEGDERRAFGIVDGEVARLADDLQPSAWCGGEQVAGDLGLAIDGDVAAGERLEVDADQPVVGGQVEAVLYQPLGVYPHVDAQPAHQTRRHRLQHAGADAPLDIGLRLTLDDHRVDAFRLEQMAEQQPRRSGADDDDLTRHAAATSARISASSATAPCPRG